ncbi:hypothetical protein YerA41_082 [Yersinia phage YerA41]|jgi:hypothetical protein|uniref:Uncharacterized protein n=1 Tax=Yersinia phage vB_Yru_GN1 TaxID=3074381 RepID=A0AA86IWX6_9CAUD|nr:hypothetical protein YerA41_082 [Yersinia phage YerA41]BES79892.1 hypothetical protein [Yersinia phage vB_Yru_GN1]
MDQSIINNARERLNQFNPLEGEYSSIVDKLKEDFDQVYPKFIEIYFMDSSNIDGEGSVVDLHQKLADQLNIDRHTAKVYAMTCIYYCVPYTRHIANCDRLTN